MRRSFASFRKGTDGTATIEFVSVFFVLVAILTFVIEVALYIFFQMTLEKAAEAGVRMAVISPSVIAVPYEIAPNLGANAQRGQRCRPDGDADDDPCIPIFGMKGRQISCGKGAGPCGPAFTRIVDEMARFNGNISEDDVRITYTDLGIGFAGGPPVPMVTVTVSGVEFQSAFLGLLLDRRGQTPKPSDQYQLLPPRSASMTAESLGS